MSENNGVFTYTGSSTTNPYTYTITFGPKSDYYFVHFNPGLGGEGTMASQAILKGGTANLTPCTFTGLNGMVFDRWTTNLDGTGTSYANGASITLTSAITLYAQWTYNYTVHFDANGGSGTMADQTVNVNSTGNLNANTFTYTGYVFAGWNTKADGSGTTYTDSASFSELNVTSAQITLYAQWRPFYTVHFDGNGATGGTMADQTIFRITTTNLTANAFTRDGYGFSGWNTEADGSGTAYTDQQTVLNLAAPGETITLYAQWQIISLWLSCPIPSTSTETALRAARWPTRLLIFLRVPTSRPTPSPAWATTSRAGTPRPMAAAPPIPTDRTFLLLLI